MTPSSEPLWTPSAKTIELANITSFSSAAATDQGRQFADYAELWQWSVEDLEGFWRAVWNHFGLSMFGAPRSMLAVERMPGAQWCPDVSVNFAEYLLGRGERSDVAVIDVGEDGHRTSVTRAELRADVMAFAATLRSCGVGVGDVVAGYLPNTSHAVVAMLATAAVGAVWSSVGQDYAANAVIDRLGQLRPKVLVGATGYRFGGRRHDRLEALRTIWHGLPTIMQVICVERDGVRADAAWLPWAAAVREPAPLEFTRVPFSHPLWVLFSSGTTGRPKGIIHGHGGILLETVKQMSLHWDLREGDRLFWFTSPSWVMWNLQLSALAVGASIVCYDGSPTSPDARRLWDVVDSSAVTVFGTSPGYLQATRDGGVEPRREFALSDLRAIGSTGSPLPPDLHRWAGREAAAVPLWSMSGGTDVAGAFLGGVPTVPIWPGELSVRCLGVAAEAWDEAGRPVVGQVGELVVRRPMPSMPVGFWDDPDGVRHRDAYYSTFPGVWRHGDWISLTSRGSVVIHGRSDSTLNRHGVRMGSADIYSAAETVEGVRESLVIGAEFPDGSYWMPLFVVLEQGIELDEELIAEISRSIRSKASPRHVPDEVIQVSGIPHTRTGKKLEVPIKRIVQGAEPNDVVDPEAVDDPSLLSEYAAAARAHRVVPGHG